MCDALWYWKNTSDDWVPYGKDNNELINAEFRDGMRCFSIGMRYRIDLVNFLQVDTESSDRTSPIKRVEFETLYNTTKSEPSFKKFWSSSEGNIKSLRERGHAEVHTLVNTQAAEYIKSLCIQPGSSVLVSHLRDKLPNLDLHYGDLVYFDDQFWGTDLYVVSIREGDLILVKTLGEYGIVLPFEFRTMAREYWMSDPSIRRGFDEDDEGYYDEEPYECKTVCK